MPIGSRSALPYGPSYRPKRCVFWVLLICLALTLALPVQAITLSQSPGGIQVSVQPTGTYTVTVRRPAWTFGGNIGKPLHELEPRAGADGLGKYREIAFRYAEDGPREGTIRLYDQKPVVLFSVKYLSAAKNSNPFPKLTQFPRGLLHMTYNGVFGQYSFAKLAPDSPWTFFDSRANTFLISPASHFVIASTESKTEGEISAGIDQRILELPVGFQQQTILVVAEGIGKAFDTWGHALTDLQGKVRPPNDADILLNHIGYWTDNGATYYYRPQAGLGYSDTLLAVRDEFRKLGIPLGYIQLDSWFYPKGPRANWQAGASGIYEYIADPALFPRGLKAFQEQAGVPLVTHARWIDPNSPYRNQFQMSGNVVTDSKYWGKVAEYLRGSGVTTYEQDWLGTNAAPELNLRDPEAFLDNMGKAFARQNLTVQYCMPLPGHYLQSSKYSNVTTLRVSADRFNPDKWDAFLYGSRFASALGVWPWSDVFMSKETPNLILATLSAGPVGVGDAVGSLDRANLLHVIRSDGVIVKPDSALVPLDQSVIRDAQGAGHPMVATTFSRFGKFRAVYVFAYSRGAEDSISFEPLELGLRGAVYVYNTRTGKGLVVTDTAFQDHLAGPYGYYIIVPIGKSGIAVLGDADQFVPLGKKRVSQLMDNGVSKLTIVFGPGEDSRTLFGYSPSIPTIHAVKGKVAQPTYDLTNHLFRVSVSPGANRETIVELHR
jgi:hypothetical protein